MAVNPGLFLARHVKGRSQRLRFCLALSDCTLKRSVPALCHVRHESSDVIPAPTKQASPQPKPTAKAITISKAMRAYVERVKAHDSMMKAEVADYEIGKRHLANIMGKDPDSFTQADVDKAIEYLLPSGLFHKNARPIMKDPHKIFPKRKAAMFGLDGRPYHWMYFTALPNYYTILYDIAWRMEGLKQKEDELLVQKQFDELKKKSLNLISSEWIGEGRLRGITMEKIGEKEYKHFIVLMERLVSHPLSYLEEEFIMKYRNLQGAQKQMQICPPIKTDEDGRSFAFAKAKRKNAEASAWVYKPGTGTISINDTDLAYFKTEMYRENIMFPLSVTNLIGEVDIVAKAEHGGPTGQCGAIRLAISKALCAFVDEGVREKLRLSGMLTSDPRTKERKKPGQPGAREKFTWKRR